MKFPMVPPDDVLTGMQLTADEVGALEQRLEGAPGDLMTRSQLLGYYAGAMLASLEAAQHLERHALWLIENAPDAEVTGCAFCGVGDAQQFARAESLWRGHLERRPDDPRILTHAARFLQYSKPELAEELIVRARKVDPSGDWSLHEVPEFEPPASIAPTPVAENRLPAGSPERFYALGDLAKRALAERRYEESEALALELLELAPQFLTDWNYGNAIHCGHHVLGQLALARGDLEQARQRLLMAAEMPGSPQLMSFGPNMALAQALLERGETEVVLQFFERCNKFWSMGHGKLDAWTKDVRGGRTPNFMANLVY